MNERMLLWGFVGIMLVGLTVIAFKRPDVYRRLMLGVVPILLCLVFASVGWNFGQYSAYHSLVPHISHEVGAIFMARFIDAYDEKCVYDAAMLIVIAYLFLLGYVAHILGSKAESSVTRV